jgi:hypothetical protein
MLISELSSAGAGLGDRTQQAGREPVEIFINQKLIAGEVGGDQ